MQTTLIKALLLQAHISYENAHNKIVFSNDKMIDRELCDIKNKPYMFVLACVMDRQISAERAWSIPHKVCEHFQVRKFADLAALRKEDIINYFVSENLHRFNIDLGTCFYDAVQRIQNVYGGDASKIWANNPSSAAVVYRFLCFKGIGIKIATMATNILSRDLGIKFSDMSAIDISPDIHVCRVLYRLGLTESTAREAAIYKAKEIFPPFPGLLDLVCWQYGRDYCHPSQPECKKCPMESLCAKCGINDNKI